MLSKETQELVNELVKRWDEIKQKAFPWNKKGEYSSEVEDTPIGKIWWNTPHLIWIMVTDKEEGYEGSQSQIGVAKDGSLRWQYQSHCSCNSYEDTEDMGEQFTVDTLKSFDFTYTNPPLDWELQMRKNLRTLLSTT